MESLEELTLLRPSEQSKLAYEELLEWLWALGL